MNNRFKDKNILIVGGSSGIGHALAKQLLEEGGNVFVAGRNRPDLPVTFLEWDATQPNSQTFDRLPEQLHGWVYCAGTITLRPFTRLTTEDFSNDWQINVLGAIAALQPNINRLKKSKEGSVVFFSSVAAQTGLSFHTSIAAAKGALHGLALSLAAEYASSGIRFNVVAPSLTDTPLAESLLSTAEKREASAKRHPLGRIGSPEDAASAAAFLLSEEASWMTGQLLGVDGGMGNLK